MRAKLDEVPAYVVFHDATLAETRAQAAIETENVEQMRGTVGDLRETALPPPTTLVPQ